MSRKPHIFLNDNIISHNQRGMKRYFREVINGSIDRLGKNITVCSPDLRDYGAATYIPSLQYHHYQPLRLNQLIVMLATYLKQPDILFNAYYADMKTRAAQVFTVYDMIPELMPRYFNPQITGNQRFMSEKKRCLEHAALIFSISKSTAKDLLKCYPHIDEKKIIITPLGVDNLFLQHPVLQNSVTVTKPFFLFVGHRMAYKNFLRFLIAFGQSGLAKDFDLYAISPGGKNLSPEEFKIVQSHQIEKSVHIMTNVSDEMLREHYANAVALVYPSEYEGFGLPILEAMASGTLVATSNVASMPEVGSDIAFYFDPLDPASIADCLRSVADLPKQQRIDTIQRGIARAQTFTWEQCQQKTVDALLKIA